MFVPLYGHNVHPCGVIVAELKRDEFRMLLLGGDLHHRAQSLPGLDVGEAFARGDFPQAVHVRGGDEQVTGGNTSGDLEV